MKAVAVFPKGREVKVIDAPEPRLRSPTQVRVRTLEVGVCGTDKEVVQSKHGKPPEGEDHLIVGHECLGEVVEVGEQVKGLAPGDLVVPRVRRPCPVPGVRAVPGGVLGLLRDGRVHGAGDSSGARLLRGALRGGRAMAAQGAARAAGGGGADGAAHHRREGAARGGARADAHAVGAKEAGRAVVLGAGPVGLLGAMALVRAGFQTTMYSRSPKPNPKAEVSESLGVPYVSSKQHRVEELVKQRGRADVVYEAAGVASAAFVLMKALAPNGVYRLHRRARQRGGGAGRGRADEAVVMNNQVVLGTVNAAAEDFEAAVEDLGRFRTKWPGGLERLITARHPPEAYAEVVRGPRAAPSRTSSSSPEGEKRVTLRMSPRPLGEG